MSEALEIRSPAKINWMLRVLERRQDGYHELETLFQTISLFDRVRISRSKELSLRCDAEGVPNDESNLAMRAAQAMMEAFRIGPVKIEIDKRIPAGGGLGGGSSNAAATLRGMVRLFALREEPERLAEIALSLGSDVPFFLVGGTAYATGRGELLHPLPDLDPIPLLLLFPEERVMTAEAFGRLVSARSDRNVPVLRTGRAGAEAMVATDLLHHAADLVNDLEEPVFGQHPHFRELRDLLLELGASWAALSGSGSTIVGAFRDTEARRKAAMALGSTVHWGEARVLSRAESLIADPA